MKKKLFIAALFVHAILLCTCDPDPLTGDGYRVKKFWAQNMTNDTYYQLEAELLAENTRCTVWVEKGSGVSAADAKNIADAYLNTIYPKMTDTFYFYERINTGSSAKLMNAMDIADYLAAGDGKLCILLLDIKDDYEKGVNDSFVGGYFAPINLYSSAAVAGAGSTAKTNECAMIYIDIYPQKPDAPGLLLTLAHEMQHMMNFALTFVVRADEDDAYLMDTWINEGLSSAAEWLIADALGVSYESRMNWYNEDSSGLIQKGNNFFVWDNHEDNIYAVLDDYATVYLFFQWLRLQSAPGKKIYSDIITSSHYDHTAVASAANSAISGNGFEDWGKLLQAWLTANYKNDSAGIHGYKNDSVLKQVKAHTAPADTTSLVLYPGEGVYSITGSGFSKPAGTANIIYDTFEKGSEGVLLTYNKNTVINGNAEPGTTTGIAAVVSIDASKDLSRSAVSLNGPYPIGAADVLRQNGFGRNAFDFAPAKLRLETAPGE